ncbi:MAG TPA: SGNH/GDSL hydrolase family protein [Kineosporiaceae bacterium]|nr:SGNH/GDSL hydrolase family protein [Kineosporiaceae bacterium]
MSTLRLAVLGDSIAYGTGAARTADTLGPRLTAALAATGVRAEHRVFAVPGAVSADLAAQAERARAWRAQLVVIVVGANDLTRLVPPERAADALGAAVAVLRGAGAQVVLAPAPDLSIVPHVPPFLREVVRAGSAVLRAAQVRVVRAAGGLVADADGTTSTAFAADPALFSGDRFHPSSAGYAVIAAALAPVVEAAARRILPARDAG